MPSIDPKYLADITERLRTLDGKHKLVPLETLQALFAQVVTHRPDTSPRRDWLLEALRHAESKGVIKLPKEGGKVWDRTAGTALPKHIIRVFASPPLKERWWVTYHWHPWIDWAADLPDLPHDQGDFLLKVQEGLVKGWFEQPGTLRHRSIQLTGQDKRLGELMNTMLFGPSRLNRELLNLVSDVMPLAWEFVGPQPIALVFENKEPYNLALRVLQNLPDLRPYGVLAYGSGGSFLDAVRSFERIGEQFAERYGVGIERIEYVGDLDWKGLSIAFKAARRAEEHGNLPPVVPAAGLHQQMLKELSDPSITHPDGLLPDKRKRAHKPEPKALEWLPVEVRTEVARILGLGRRVPEEMLTAAALLELWGAA